MKALLDELLSGEGKLSLLLLKANEHAIKSGDENLIEFIEKEINGYSSQDLPEYRKIKGEIVVDLKNAYGEIVKIEYPINFSALSDSIEFDVSTTYIVDGVGFIEDGLNNTDGKMLLRPIHNEIVKMLNEPFHRSNPHVNITKAAHRVGRAGIQFILTKVRQELIVGLQKIKGIKEIKESEKNEIGSFSKPSGKKSIFVTYAWESEEHNDKIISFTEFLLSKGYEASMDRKESQEQTATNFNQMMIEGLKNSDKVIIVLSEKYKEKADSFSGGVGIEFGIIFEELKTSKNKFVFVSFGQNKNSEIVPMAISGRDILNLKKDQDENNFNELFAKLESKNTIEFSKSSDVKIEVRTKEIKPFKL